MTKGQKDYIFGLRAVEEAVRGGMEIEKVLIRKGISNPAFRDLSTMINRLKIPILKVPEEKLNRITRKNHQGIIAFLSSITYASLDHIISDVYGHGEDPLLLMLDRVTDVRNFGAIARTAEGLGFHAIIIPARGSASINEEAMKTSAGALAHLPVCRVKNLQSTVTFLKNNGISILGCTEKANENIFSKDLRGPIAMILGSEFDGISPDLLKLCDVQVSLPMFGRVDSYNVSVSMAMAGTEIVRQRLD